MTKTTFSVPAAFVIAGHAQACTGWQTHLETKFPQLFPKAIKTEFRIGDKFNITHFEGTKPQYMLCQFENQMVGLINMENGNRWTNPIKVANPTNITIAELKDIYDRPSFKDLTFEGKTISTKAPARPKEVKVDTDFIKDAYASANPEWKKKIKEQFPQIWPQGKYVPLITEAYDSKLTLSSSDHELEPGVHIGIANGYAPSGLERKSIYVAGSGVEAVEVKEHNGRWIISIKRKQS